MKQNETHISTKQSTPQEDDRLSSPHENRIRAQAHQSPPQTGPQKTFSMSFPKSLRLRTRREFQRVSKGGERNVGRLICVDWRPANKPKLGISAPVRYGTAPERSRFKRLVREAFRKCYATLPRGEAHVVPRQAAKGAQESDIAKELIRLIHDTQ